jgi:hypothetical protein
VAGSSAALPHLCRLLFRRREFVSNYDMMVPYDERMASWLKERGYSCPAVAAMNRFPRKEEVIRAIESTGRLTVENGDRKEFFAVKKGTKPGGGYEIRIHCSNWARVGESDTDSIMMHGANMTVQLILLEILSHICGQLLIYPDTGAPAIIVEPRMDTERIARLWEDSLKQHDCWDYFYRNVGH